ncbi:MAG: M10 family metallopeptidase C-terminal domain-containing protein [Pseudomonadota bacterium]
MCGFCMAAELADPCKGENGTLGAEIGAATAESGVSAFVIPDNTSTSATITIGGTQDETLEFVGDKDWFRIDLTAGDAIQIDLFGLDHSAGNGFGELLDPYVRIRDSAGNFLAENDDIVLGIQRDSRLVFQATTTDSYFIEVDSYLSNFTGDYRLQVSATTPPPPASPVDSVETAFTLNTNDPVLVYFAQAGDTYNYDGTTYTATGINAYEQGQLWSIFEGVEEFADIDFEITTNRSAADLEWATDTLPSVSGGTLLGFFFFPSSNGNGGYGILNNNSSGFPSWNSSPGGTLDTGGFMYGVAVHELGHGLGLAHPHDGGGGSDVMQGVSSSSSRGNFGLNQAPFTAMSYNEGWNDNPAGFANSVAATGHGATFGALDVAALQNMYGVNTTHASGDDVYTLFDTQSTGSGAGYYTTWDTGGTDEFRYSGVRAATIDLREATLLYENGGGGFMSYVDGIIAGRTIANGVVIENATGGSGADTLIGNDAANVLTGNAGNDTLTGGAGADTFAFSFGDGFDTIADFEIGTDLIGFEGLGLGFTDLVITDVSGNARVTYDFTTTGQITLTGITAASLSATDFLLDPTGPITGTEGADNLTGTSADDEILGLGGNDTIDAVAGNDSIDAGAGDDTVVYTSGADTIDGGADSDWIDLRNVAAPVALDFETGGLGITLSNVENVLLSDLGNEISADANANTILGGSGGDTISTRGGDDSIQGGDGNDTLDGGAGNDTINAGAGDDTIVYSDGADSIDGGVGSDWLDLRTASSPTSFSLTSGAGLSQLSLTNVENLILSDASYEIEANDSDNTIIAGAGDDTIVLLSGNDSIEGGAGNDYIVVGIGNDSADGGDGIDILQFGWVSSTEASHVIDLAAGIATSADGDVAHFDNFEIYTALGAVNTFLGSSGDDVVDTNSGNNQAFGAGGSDTLSTGAGSDTLDGGSDDDLLSGGSGEDLLIGGTGDDTLTGGADADEFAFSSGDGIDIITDFELGVDVIDLQGLGIGFVDLNIVDVGGGAQITYDFVTTGQVTLQGISAVGLKESDFLLDVSASPAIVGTFGNDNLVGTSGSDEILALGGGDTLDGGTGDDTFTGGTGADTYRFANGDGIDTIVDFEVGTDQIDLRGLGLSYNQLLIIDVIEGALVQYDFSTNAQIIFSGLTAAQLTSDVFLLDNASPAPPAIQIDGTSNGDVLNGTSAAEEISGFDGADVLIGRGGGDRLISGLGDDRHYIYSPGDEVIEFSSQGYDRTYSSISFALGAHVEAGTALGTDDIDIAGNDINNWIGGNSGQNVLRGGGGRDRLIGLDGDDTLHGGAGNDVLEGGAGADVFRFASGTGTDNILDFEVGVDTIDVSALGIAYADMTIIDHVHGSLIIWDDPGDVGSRGYLVVVGVDTSELDLGAFTTAFGNTQPAILGTDGAEILTGSQIGDEIIALGGNDQLLGEGGADTLIGGAGNDRYFVDDVADIVVELAGEGDDLVYTEVDFTLSDNVEDARATGPSDVNLTGNAEANWLTGNASSNVLSGGAGKDRLQGWEGSDTLIGNTGNDVLEGGTGSDVFVFNLGDGVDVILDFEDGLDRIDMSSQGLSFADLRIVTSGANVIVFYDRSDPADYGLVTVNNLGVSDLTASDFILI